ncbi:uncharacterized protein LOC117118799 [Anneissia japonica]|uniref:uncharacterized protein LOC117118799 n=1 Tax=Anneissia japonica TaxID=1529436 RepID=UPI00142582B5|nr:uncharacterized protein LOC117118799 [Anneissia japonica]
MKYLFELRLDENAIEYLPAGGFKGCSSLSLLHIAVNRIKLLDGKHLEGLDSISDGTFKRNMITNVTSSAMQVLCKQAGILNFGNNLLTTLRPGFFSGTSVVNDIYLSVNFIPYLPDYLFRNSNSKDDFGIKLGSVHFQNMTLEDIGDNAFFGVESCLILQLSMNRLKSIPKAVTNLNVYNYILLGNNKITSLPDLAFNASRGIGGIFLNGNLLQRIPSGAFAKLHQLRELYLYKNQITYIEAGAFSDNVLERLYLFDNLLTAITPNLFVTSFQSILNLYLFFNPVKTIHPQSFTELADNATIIGTCCDLENIPKLQAHISLTCVNEFRVPQLMFPMVVCDTLNGNGYKCSKKVMRRCHCDPCSKGYYGAIIDFSCVPCPPGGYYLDEIGVSKGFTYSDNCKTCNNGTYVPPERAPGRSLSECQVCPFGTQTNKVAGSRACQCIENYHRVYRFGRCFKCTTRGIKCPSEYQQLKPGFWWYWQSLNNFYQYSNFTIALAQENYNNPNVRRYLHFSGSLPYAQECPRPKSCPGDTIYASCADGFTGWMCTQCKDGFYPWFDSCNKCPSVWHFLLIYSVIILALLILTGLVLWVDSKRKNTSLESRTTADMVLARVKIVIGFYQVLAGIFSTLSYIHWPEALANIGQHLQNIALNIIKIASPQCLDPRFKLNAYREFIFGITWPIIVISSIYLIYIIKKFISKSKYPKKELPSKMAETKRLCFQYTLSLLFLTYPNSCNTIFSLFPSICKSFWIDENKNYQQTRLKSDFSISCEDDKYKIFMFAAYTSLLYVIGFPLGLLFLLWKFRNKSCQQSDHVTNVLSVTSDIGIVYEDPSMVYFDDDLDDASSRRTSIQTTVSDRMFGFNDPYGLRAFHESYNSRCWFWEVVELVRKLTLTSLIIFFGSTSRTQIGAAAFLAILFLILHVAFRPMKDNFEHWLQLLSLATIVLNLLIGVILMVPVDDNINQTKLDRADEVGVQIILVLVDFGIIMLFVVSTFRSLYKALKYISKENEKKVNVDNYLRFVKEEINSSLDIQSDPLF